VTLGLIKSNKMSPIVKKPVMNEPPTTLPKCLHKNTLNGWKHESSVP